MPEQTNNFKVFKTSNIGPSRFLKAGYSVNDPVSAAQRHQHPDDDSRFTCLEDEEWCLEEPNPPTSEIQKKIQGVKAALGFIKHSPDPQPDR